MGERVLVIEDDVGLAAQVQDLLRSMDLEPIWWREGHHIDPEHTPDVALVILDLMLPRVPGMSILKELRAGSDVPVLVLSAREDARDKVQALQLGADDYLTKPFWPEELRARVMARLRRPVLQRGSRLEVGRVSLDTARRDAWVDGLPVELTRLEFDFLLALARRPGVAISRAWLANHLLDPDGDGGDRTLDVHVSRLRKKLGSGVVETVWGTGYRLVASP